jgi:hypothetical protein
MSAVPNQVPAFEHGLLRLWAFDGRSETGRALIEALKAEPRNAGPVDAALGAERVDPYWLDLVALRDISELGLAGYLRQGYDVPQDQLDALDLPTAGDHVLIAPSRAFADHEQTLSPSPDLAPVGLLDIHEDVGALRPMEPVETARRDAAPAEPAEPPPGPPAGRGLRPGAILILLLIAAAFIAVVAF